MIFHLKVETAKQEMERELMKELEKRREERYNEEKRREVRVCLFVSTRILWTYIHFSLDSVSQPVESNEISVIVVPHNAWVIILKTY